ncbi:uncharacterized protein LOC128552911 [Mercenaria mercenaria]|uniref:uncharacterized protein LOC128552911 n=1 Tax=Mercenaria mercenaria TaxID=6596 RepID=UPI00234F4F58|nr:uncharacterized protein LOC128552911 [Mercenaria mercenaria]
MEENKTGFENVPTAIRAVKQTSYECKQINKRVLGGRMLSLCGNEGTEDDSNNAGLRRLFQLAISVTENESEKTLENAEFKFYDDECNIRIVYSGSAENRFLFTFNEKLEPDFTVKRKSVLCGLDEKIKRTWRKWNPLNFDFDEINLV